MAATGISFFFEEDKVEILRNAADEEYRTTSSYIQLLFDDHIKEVESGKIAPKPVTLPAPKKKRVFKRRKK